MSPQWDEEDSAAEEELVVAEVKRLYLRALASNWSIPSETDVHGPASWLRYWRAREEMESAPSRDPNARVGRPVPPHMPGAANPTESLLEYADRVNRSNELWRGYRP